MRHARPVRVRQQVQFLRRQFAQDNRLPFSEVLTEDLITNTLDALSVVWVDLGNRVHIAAVISSTIPWLAWLPAVKYPVDMEVDVHYNPQKPSESVLHPWSLWVAVPWLFFVGLFGLGWALGGGKKHLFQGT